MSTLLLALVSGLKTAFNIRYQGEWQWLGRHSPIVPDPHTSVSDSLLALKKYVVTIPEAVQKDYDVIVIGGGAAGCSLSRTMSDDHRVLLIERGGLRSSAEAYESRLIDTAGLVVANPLLSQPVITSNGVISHVANLLGGGTSINMGISIKETASYYDHMYDQYGFDLDYEEMEDAMDWVRERSVYPMPQDTLYARGLKLFARECYGRDRGPQDRLELNSSWQGETFFDPTRSYERAAADVLLKDAPEDSFDLLIETHANTISFDDDGSARCVSVTNVHERYPNTIVSTAPGWIEALKAPLFDHSIGLFVLDYLPEWLKKLYPDISRARSSTQSPSTADVCVRPGGRIVVSTGTLMSPTILANSGIGTTESLEASGAPPRVVNESIGKNMVDRALIPIGIFMNNDYDYNEKMQWSLPRIVESIGIKVGGDPDFQCQRLAYEDPFGPMFRSDEAPCNLQTLESLGGANIAEGVIYASLYFVPPSMRQHPLLTEFITVIRNCEYDLPPFGLDFAKRLICPQLDEAMKCLRKIRAVFYFQPQPLSTFDMELKQSTHPGNDPDAYGQGFNDMIMEIKGEYISTPTEANAAMAGIASILKGIEDGYFDEASADNGVASCPRNIIVGVIGAITRIYESLAIGFALMKNKQNLYTRLTESLDGVALKQSMKDSDQVRLEQEKLERVFSKWESILHNDFNHDVEHLSDQILKYILDDPPRDENGNPTLNLAHIHDLPEHIAAFHSSPNLARKAIQTVVGQKNDDDQEESALFHQIDDEPMNDGDEQGKLLNLEDLPSSFVRRLKAVNTPRRRLLDHAIDRFYSLYSPNGDQEEDHEHRRRLLESHPDWLSYWDIDAFVEGDVVKGLEHVKNNEKVTTFPPVLPSTADPKQLFNFIMTYKTSIWHWISSLRASDDEADPVDNDFAIRGVDNLHVVDASILPMLPRMNPAITLIGLGRYAARRISSLLM